LIKPRAFGAAVLLAFSLGTPAAFAIANPNNNGNGSNAPGQARADENCGNVIDKQTAMGVSAGGGPKQGVPAPTNCDHFFNPKFGHEFG
jgi:hypothetical protein